MKKFSRRAGRALSARLGRLVPVARVRDHREPALSPDTLVHVGEQKTETMALHVVDYDSGGIRDLTTTSVEECCQFENRGNPTWIRVVGLHETEKVSELLGTYGIHPLVQSDILNTKQLPKVDSFENYLFVVLKLIAPHPQGEGLVVENVSLLFIDNLVITFQESPAPVFEPVLVRLRSGKSRIQRAGGDYLVWAILDAIVDHYFVALERIEDEVEELDKLLLNNAADINPAPIHALKQQVYHLHRLIRPGREVAATLGRSDCPLIEEKTQIYFRDLYDHVVHAIDITENLREAASTLRDFHLAAVSNRMNEVMKVLTCFATIFLPLTFLAGIYGMNFEHMPELAIRWAYPALWGSFLLLAAGMILFFRKMRWL